MVDDEALVRQALAGLLSLESDLEVIGEAANGALAIEACARLEPHVVLMDLQMPVMDGVAATRELASRLRVVVLTTFQDDDLIYSALQAGACGYLLKDCGGSARGRLRSHAAQPAGAG